MSIAEEVVRRASLDLSVLLGDWRNTNPAARIGRIVCAPAENGRMMVHVWSAPATPALSERRQGRRTPESARDWGVADASVFAFTFDGDEAGAFAAVYDFGFEEVRLQANVKLGVLVVATFNSFADDSGRSNYFNREFFYRIAP